MDTPSEKSCTTCCSWWKFPLLLGIVLAAILISHFWPAESPNKLGTAAGPHESPGGEHVLLTIDFGDGRTKDFADIVWRRGLTVADSLASAAGLLVEQKGSGQGALLTSIDGVANQGADGKNWTFDVNDQSADRSFAVYELQAGDHVLWTFGLQR